MDGLEISRPEPRLSRFFANNFVHSLSLSASSLPDLDFSDLTFCLHKVKGHIVDIYLVPVLSGPRGASPST